MATSTAGFTLNLTSRTTGLALLLLGAIVADVVGQWLLSSGTIHAAGPFGLAPQFSPLFTVIAIFQAGIAAAAFTAALRWAGKIEWSSAVPFGLSAAVIAPGVAKALAGIVLLLGPSQRLSASSFDLVTPVFTALQSRADAIRWTEFFSVVLILLFGMICLHGRIERVKPATYALAGTSFVLALFGL